MEISTLQVFESDMWPVAAGGEETYPLLSSCCAEELHVYPHDGVVISTAQWGSRKSGKSCVLPNVTRLVNRRAGIWIQFSLVAQSRRFHIIMNLSDSKTGRLNDLVLQPAMLHMQKSLRTSSLQANYASVTSSKLCALDTERREEGRERDRERLMSINLYYPKAQGSVLWAPWQVCCFPLTPQCGLKFLRIHNLCVTWLPFLPLSWKAFGGLGSSFYTTSMVIFFFFSLPQQEPSALQINYAL